MATHATVQSAGQLSEVEIEEAVAGCDAGHRIACLEPDDFDRDLARRQLRGEMTADEAVKQAIARALAAS